MCAHIKIQVTPMMECIRRNPLLPHKPEDSPAEGKAITDLGVQFLNLYELGNFQMQNGESTSLCLRDSEQLGVEPSCWDGGNDPLGEELHENVTPSVGRMASSSA